MLVANGSIHLITEIRHLIYLYFENIRQAKICSNSTLYARGMIHEIMQSSYMKL